MTKSKTEEEIITELEEIMEYKRAAIKYSQWSLAADFKKHEDNLLAQLPLIQKLKEIGITNI